MFLVICETIDFYLSQGVVADSETDQGGTEGDDVLRGLHFRMTFSVLLSLPLTAFSNRG